MHASSSEPRRQLSPNTHQPQRGAALRQMAWQRPLAHSSRVLKSMPTLQQADEARKGQRCCGRRRGHPRWAAGRSLGGAWCCGHPQLPLLLLLQGLQLLLVTVLLLHQRVQPLLVAVLLLRQETAHPAVQPRPARRAPQLGKCKLSQLCTV